jgi:hypothetical protein
MVDVAQRISNALNVFQQRQQRQQQRQQQNVNMIYLDFLARYVLIDLFVVVGL